MNVELEKKHNPLVKLLLTPLKELSSMNIEQRKRKV